MSYSLQIIGKSVYRLDKRFIELSDITDIRDNIPDSPTSICILYGYLYAVNNYGKYGRVSTKDALANTTDNSTANIFWYDNYLYGLTEDNKVWRKRRFIENQVESEV
jgi:hypothetical protein